MNKKKTLTLAMAITTLTTLTLYILNRLLFFAATAKEALSSSYGNYYTWRFGKIFYTKQGEGSPLLLVHDLNPSSSDYEWKEVVKRLKKDHTVYTLDLLGCGRSDKQKITYTSYLYVQMLSDFCKEIIKEPTDIVVTGHAAQSVLMACSINGNYFHTIILVNPDSLAKDAEKCAKYKNKALQLLIHMPVIGTFIYNMAVARNLIEEQFEENYFGSRTKIPEKYIDAYHEAAHLGGSSAKYLYSSIRCRYTKASVPVALKKINHNVIIFGGESVPKIKNTIAQYQNYNLSIQSVLLKGCGYLPQLEFPQRFCENLQLYLK